MGVAVLVAAGLVVGLAAQSFASGGSGSPPPQAGLPTTITLPPISLPGLPTLQLPPVTLPALPPLLGAPTPSGTPGAGGLSAYQGLGAWIDLYHYGNPGDDQPATVVRSMASHGVRTVFVETSRWNSASALDHPAEMAAFVDAAHSNGLKVVGWYMPGFADITTDVQRSLAVLNFTSPAGQHIDGFAADIEDHSATGSLNQFNAGIATYAQALRQAAGASATLGAIVPDAKNNERAPAHWAGFPWPAIGDNFDVVQPMAYWSVTKFNRTCLSTQMDVTAYMNRVIDQTESLMGKSRPIAPMGGIAYCDTEQEVAQYVSTLQARGAIGGGLYDFYATEGNSHAATLWSELAPLNH